MISMKIRSFAFKLKFLDRNSLYLTNDKQLYDAKRKTIVKKFDQDSVTF